LDMAQVFSQEVVVRDHPDEGDLIEQHLALGGEPCSSRMPGERSSPA
jgi:hypothetical protein